MAKTLFCFAFFIRGQPTKKKCSVPFHFAVASSARRENYKVFSVRTAFANQQLNNFRFLGCWRLFLVFLL